MNTEQGPSGAMYAVSIDNKLIYNNYNMHCIEERAKKKSEYLFYSLTWEYKTMMKHRIVSRHSHSLFYEIGNTSLPAQRTHGMVRVVAIPSLALCMCIYVCDVCLQRRRQHEQRIMIFF